MCSVIPVLAGPLCGDEVLQNKGQAMTKCTPWVAAVCVLLYTVGRALLARCASGASAVFA